MKKPWLWLLGLSFFVHFLIWGHPNQVVFDEVTFLKFIDGYLTGQYYFDLHPPLGKLLFAIPAYLFSWNPQIGYEKIGDVYGSQPIQWLRLLPILCGTFLPIVVYWLCSGLSLSVRVAGTAAFFLIFENALLVISSFVLLDIYLVFFGFLALALYFESRRRNHPSWFYCACLAASASFLIKWTGLSFVGIIFLLEVISPTANIQWKRLLKGSLIFVFFYAFVFWIHFQLLPKSGLGDLFMSAAFQTTLAKDSAPAASPGALSFVEKFSELNRMMWAYHQTMNQPHPYSSSWMTWPWMKRPIYFWISGEGAESARIYFLGNPILWWASFIAILFLLVNFVVPDWQKKKSPPMPKSHRIILLGFLANFLPFLFIGRLTFIYHYIPALVFSVMALAILLNELKLSPKYLWAVGACVFICFCFFAPISYGWPLSQTAYQWRVWVSTWY